MYEPSIKKILDKITKEMGAQFIVEPEFNCVGQIVFKNGRQTYFYNTTFEINNAVSAKIAKDKAYTAFFLEKRGYKVAKGQTFFCENLLKVTGSDRNIDEGLKYGKELGYPFIIKPNSLAMGELVTKIYDDEQYYEVAPQILQKNEVMLVQKYYKGNDYRVVVLDEEIIAVYQRAPLSIQGDGKSAIEELIYEKEEKFRAQGRERVININDSRINENLTRLNLSLDSVLECGATIKLLDNANLSTGGEAMVCTIDTHDDFKSLAINACKELGLRYCGMDIIADDITKPVADQQYIILEVNSSPSLSNYSAHGEEHYKIVENMYRDILYKLEQE